MKQNNQKWKTKFRSSKAWKDFRTKLRHKQKVDPITGQKLTRLSNCHHMILTDDEKVYSDLSNEDNFLFCNQFTHKCMHFFCNKKDWRKRLLNLIHWVKLMAKKNGYD